MFAVDSYTDSNQEILVKIATDLPQVLDRLSDVEELELDDIDNLTEGAFAWPEEKMYPIYTKEAALLSSVYLEGADVPEMVKTACEEACLSFGYEVKIGSLEKVASEEGLTADDFVLPGRMKLPVVDAETYAASEDLFLNNLNDFSLDEIVVGARQLVKKASDYSVEPNEDLKSFGLQGNLDVEMAKQVAMSRYSTTADPEYLSISDRLSGSSYGSIEKIAEFMVDTNTADKENGINDAVSLFQAIDTNAKSEAILLGGEEYSLEKIASIDEGEWLDIADEGTVGYLFADGEFNPDNFVEIVNDSSESEYEVIESFVQNKARN